MAAARACMVFLSLVAALLLDGVAAAAAAEGNAGARPLTLRQRQVRNLLKRLNKPPLATIQSPDGDTIDCVHISNQPAFDHPSSRTTLFSSTQTRTCSIITSPLRMQPSYHPEGLYDESKVTSQQWNTQTITQMWHQNGMCPENTIPIKRTKEEDIQRASSVRRFGKKKGRSTANPMSVNPDMPSHEYALAYVQGGKYYGAKATINVWQPEIEQAHEFSLSQLWIVKGTYGQDNTIEAGWQVCPEVYGDYNTRLFTYWTSDAYQDTGCYDLLCLGFIQISNQIAVGGSIFPISNYGGSQYEITILVFKAPSTLSQGY